ncbi:SLAP domain-containing protein [Schleiferilactobacillus harbinensis]|uniref:SLAP domain-containing protein n=1 Tax=Schleiferilactobacillus harbinensis TaxID=304207 RepID=UPI0039E749F4
MTTDTGYRRGFRLGGDQYVKLADANYYTVKERFNGVYTVSVLNHPTWGTAVYNRQFKPIRILPAQSKWRVYGSYFIHGKTYFDLGGQQYISKEYGAMEVLDN